MVRMTNPVTGAGLPPALIAPLFAGAACADLLGDACAGALLVEEELCVREALPARRREFTMGRVCARRALESLGVPSSPILTGKYGEPVWPPGIAGSITHTRGYCGVVVARKDPILGLGVDAELIGNRAWGLRERFLTPAELDLMEAARHEERIMLATLIFSAKEAVFKCCQEWECPRRWLDFKDLVIVPDQDDGCFSVMFTNAERESRIPGEITGRFLSSGNWILTGATRRRSVVE